MKPETPDPWSSPAAPEVKQGGECPLAPLPTEPAFRPGTRLPARTLWITWFTILFTLGLGEVIEPMQLVVIGAGGPALLVAVSILRMLVSSERLNALNNRGLVALNEERFDDAVLRFEELARASRGSSIHRQVALHNLALAELCRARWDYAASLLASVETLYKRSVMKAQVGQSSAALLALIHAIKGELPAARCWLKAGEKRKDVPTAVGLEVLAEAIVHTRAGNYDSAEQLLAHRWRAANSALSGRFLGALRFVRAFALVNAGRDGPLVRDLVLGARPYTDDSFDFVFKSWPELARFVAETEGQVES